MSDDITVELSKPVKFTPEGSGEQVDGSFVIFREPTAAIRELKICTFLKQQFFIAATSGSDKKDKDEPEYGKDKKDATGKGLIYALYACQAVDMTKVFEKAKELFKIVGKIAGAKLLTDHMLNSMHPEDLEKLLGEYMLNFILRSVLSET